jgi:hypothetical protein
MYFRSSRFFGQYKQSRLTSCFVHAAHFFNLQDVLSSFGVTGAAHSIRRNSERLQTASECEYATAQPNIRNPTGRRKARLKY